MKTGFTEFVEEKINMNNARIAAIFQRLRQIAELFGDMAEAGTANAGNQIFDQLMQEHRRLTDEAHRILNAGNTDQGFN